LIKTAFQQTSGSGVWSHLRGDALTPNLDGYVGRAASRDLIRESDVVVLYAQCMQPSHPILQFRDFMRGCKVRRVDSDHSGSLPPLDSLYHAIQSACHVQTPSFHPRTSTRRVLSLQRSLRAGLLLLPRWPYRSRKADRGPAWDGVRTIPACAAPAQVVNCRRLCFLRLDLPWSTRCDTRLRPGSAHRLGRASRPHSQEPLPIGPILPAPVDTQRPLKLRSVPKVDTVLSPDQKNIRTKPSLLDQSIG